MIQLDEKIEVLFMRMIKSWDKITKIKGGAIEFDNGLSISAYKKSSKTKGNRENTPLCLNEDTFSCFFPTAFNWDVITPDSDKLLFYINTPYRRYEVPEHDRHEYVEVLDILDNSIRKFEAKKLKEYLTYFEANE